MEQPGGLLMERVLVGKRSMLNSGPRWLCSAAISLLFTLAFAGTAFGQDVPVAGTVTNAAGAPIAGVTVRVQGTDTRVNTDANGNYRITAPANGTLTFAHVGSKPMTAGVGGRSRVDVTMTNVTYLEE
ncbi:MAG TPA: carboxypeptidase regulatory-like domain-containing protein, partial [Gemmatimonadaceae bacterium]